MTGFKISDNHASFSGAEPGHMENSMTRASDVVSVPDTQDSQTTTWWQAAQPYTGQQQDTKQVRPVPWRPGVVRMPQGPGSE